MGVIKLSNKRKRKTVPKTGTSCGHENGSTVEPFWMHFFSFSALFDDGQLTDSMIL